MSAIVTLEARWFLAPVEAWDVGSAPESRIDFYLDLEDPSLGVKVREGRLEVKRRHRLEALPSGAGMAETWSKVTAPLSDAALGETGWIVVEKARRWVRIGAAPLPFAELTTVRVLSGSAPAAAATTVGIEVDAREPNASSRLEAAAGALAAHLPPGALAVEASMGYPEWLARR